MGSHKKVRLRVVFGFYSPDGNEVSIPIASMSAYLKREFDEVEVLLAPILVGRYPERFSPASYARSITELDADLLAFSLMSPHWHPVEPFLEAIKQTLPELPVVIGGYQAILSQYETINNPSVDFICVGDGEHAIANLIRYLQGQLNGPVEGMWEKMCDGTVFKTSPHQIPDLRTLPFPDYALFAAKDGFEHVISSILGPKGKIVLPVMTGRGCPYRCSYCCNTPLLDNWKDKKTFLRKYDPEALVDELERLQKRYRVGYFEFWDELFLSNLKFVKAFFALYKQRIHIPFSINARVEVMGEKFCQLAAEAGCHTIWFGVESGDEAYRKNMLGRKTTNQQVIDAAENCKKAGIYRLTFNIVGMPNETAENMRETLELNRIIEPEYFFFFPYIPLRETPLYDIAEREGLLQPLKKAIHYLSAANDQLFELNLKEQPDRLSQQEYASICREMVVFQQRNNRLSYISGNQGRKQEVSMPDEENHLLHSSISLRKKSQIKDLGSQTRLLPTQVGNSAYHKPLQGRRLTLERIEQKHAAYLFDIYKDDEFWVHYRMNQNRSVDLKGIETRLAEEEQYTPAQLGKIEWVIFKKSGDDKIPIGLAGLTNFSAAQRHAEFLVGVVNPAERLSGIGLEASLLVFEYAFNVEKLHKLVSLIYSNNTEAQGNTMSLEFKQEGVLREHFRAGQGQKFIDVYQNGFLVSEFRASKRLSRLSNRIFGRDITVAPVPVKSGNENKSSSQEYDLQVKFDVKY